MLSDKKEREKLASALGRVVDTISSKHFGRKTQEPAITTKIGQRLEDEIEMMKSIASALEANDRAFGELDYDLTITVQDIPDRGPGSLEKISGIDLYVNITVRRKDSVISKGFIIQAKRGGSRAGLKDQCEKMQKRSNSAYAWIYKKDGTFVYNAEDVINNVAVTMKPSLGRRPEELFDAVLECTEGDLAIGLPGDVDENKALNDMLQRLRSPRGVSFVVQA